MIGAVTSRFERIQARAICAIDTPRVIGDQELERRTRFIDRRRRVETVNLIKVDRLDAQSSQAGLARLHDVLARQSTHVRPVVQRPEDLRGEYDLLEIAIDRSARPVISSLTPSEYMSAVSKKLMPASKAARKNGCAARSSSTHGRHFGSPYDMRPRQMRETVSPVVPSVVNCMAHELETFSRGAAKKGIASAASLARHRSR